MDKIKAEHAEIMMRIERFKEILSDEDLRFNQMNLNEKVLFGKSLVRLSQIIDS